MYQRLYLIFLEKSFEKYPVTIFNPSVIKIFLANGKRKNFSDEFEMRGVRQYFFLDNCVSN
jgi:hypothetical protein